MLVASSAFLNRVPLVAVVVVALGAAVWAEGGVLVGQPVACGLMAIRAIFSFIALKLCIFVMDGKRLCLRL